MTLLRDGVSHNPACFLAAHGQMVDGSDMPACTGRLIRAHLIPRQLLRREGHDVLIPDRRTWVLACGGPTGAQGHHGMLDQSRTLWLPRRALPPLTEALADELGLAWYLDKEYGELIA